jgi:Na+/proline symporter
MSVGTMFAAAMIHGLTLAVVYVVAILVMAGFRPALMPPIPVDERKAMSRSALLLKVILVVGPPIGLVVAVLGSIIATETSAVTFLSVPGLALAQGGDFGFLQLSIGLILGRLIVVVWFLPSYFRDEIYTAYDILRDRFGGLTQRTSSMIFIITRTVADGLRLYLTALVLGQVTGFGLTPSVLVIGVATMIYATMGGIRSVIWNDCIQLVVYLAGAVGAGGVIADKLPGGFGQIVSYGQETDRFVVFHPEWTLFSGNLWAGIVGGLFLAIATHGTDQMMVQRYLCSRGLKQARWAVALSGPLVAVQFALFLLVGVALAAWWSASARMAAAMPATCEARGP